MLVISSREFRQNQSSYFDKVDQGEQIIVQRGKNKAYTLTPVAQEDQYFNAAMMEKIKQGLKEAENGEYIEIRTSEEIKQLLGL
jgi:prevent-host-death family protein